MKKLFTILSIVCIAAAVNAQSYVYTTSTGTTLPYEYNSAGATTIWSGTHDQEYTAWQTLPFAWDFYGQPVTGYFVSDNGYITFDNTATVSEPSNTTLPNAGGPNNAIYAFWDDTKIAVVGTGDEVRNWTYGDPGSQVHVIQWYSITDETANTTQNFIYHAIRIYQCGDFDIVHDWRGSGYSAADGTIGCENANGTDGTDVTGSPTLDFPNIVDPGTDDEVYTFVNTNIVYNLDLISQDGMDRVTEVGQNYSLSGILENQGSAVITDFDITYDDGTGPITANISAVNIAANGGSYAWTHPTQYSPASVGLQTMTVYTSNPNGNSDALSCNDTITFDFLASNTVVPRQVLVEEFSSGAEAECATRNPAFNTLLEANNPNTPAGKVCAVKYQMNWPFAGDRSYNSDGETRKTYYGITTGAVTGDDGIPTAFLDAAPPAGGEWDGSPVNFTQSMIDEDYAVASVMDIDVTYTVTWPYTLNATVTVTPQMDIATSMTLHIGVTEDFYTYTGATSETDYYDIMRKMLPDGNGTTIGPFTAGTPIVTNETYIFAVNNPPASGSFDLWMDIFNVSLVAWVQDPTTFGTDWVHNVSVYKDPGVTGVSENTPDNVITGLYPNPANTVASLRYELNQSREVNVALQNALGQVVYRKNMGTQSAGIYAEQINVDDLPAGMYLIRLAVDGQVSTHKLTVN